MPAANSQSGSLIVSVGVQCHVGIERTENQDRVTRANTPFGDLFVVADGVGGYQGGAEAAQATVEGFVSYLNTHANFALPDALQEAARTISADLLQRSAANHLLHGMGSTVVLCVVHGDSATYAHVGDSRAYLVRGRQLKQLTRDHSVMERLVSQGVLTPAQAREHPDASVLTRALGQSADVSLDVAEIALQPRDAILLCSDGLWGYAQHSEMEAVVTSNSLSATAVSEALLNLALKGGGGDNISIQFLRFNPVEAPRMALAGSGSGKGKLLGIPVKLALPAAALASVLAVFTGRMFWDNYQHAIAKGTDETTTAKANPDEDESGTEGAKRPSKPASTTKAGAKPAATTAPKGPDKPSAATPAAQPAASAPSAPNPDASHPGEPPKPANGQAPPPASSPAQAPAPANQDKTAVTVIQGPDNSEAEWAKDLSKLDFLAISKQAGDAGCLALAKSTAMLYFTTQTAGVAKNITQKLAPESIATEEKTEDELAKCGSAKLVAMPAKSSSLIQTGVDQLNKFKPRKPQQQTDPDQPK